MTKPFIFALSAVFVLFVALGIAAFYQEPKSPEYPTELSYADSASYTPAQKAISDKYDADQKTFQQKDQIYSRNVSIVSLAIGLVIFMLCFVFVQSIPFLSASLQIGGLGTILYGVIRGFMSENAKVEFGSIAVILVIFLFSGIYKFNKLALKEAKK